MNPPSSPAAFQKLEPSTIGPYQIRINGARTVAWCASWEAVELMGVQSERALSAVPEKAKADVLGWPARSGYGVRSTGVDHVIGHGLAVWELSTGGYLCVCPRVA